MDLKNKKIVFLGDSITQGVGASEYKNCYVEMFSKITGAGVINCGIGGTRIAPQTNPSKIPEHDKDFIMRADEMESDADAVIVFGGTNDFGHGDAPFGKITDTKSDTFCGACDVLMEKLIKKYPSSPIVFITPLHRLSEDTLINELGSPRKTLKEYVDIIKQKAEKFSIPVLDLFSYGGMQPNIEVQNKLYFIDGLHPNDTGHERIAKLIKQFLENNVL